MFVLKNVPEESGDFVAGSCSSYGSEAGKEFFFLTRAPPSLNKVNIETVTKGHACRYSYQNCPD